MLGVRPALYLSSYIPHIDPQERLRSNKLLNKNVSCELVGDFLLVPLHVQGGDVLEQEQTLLPLPGIDP